MLAWLGATALRAADQFHCTRIDIADGLSQPGITCILADGKGALWIGTRSGLNKYRGGRIKTYVDRENGEASIAGNQVFLLFLDSGQRLWVSTDKGLSLYSEEADAFLPARSETVLCALETDREIYFGGFEGLLVYDKASGRFDRDPLGAYSTAVIGIFDYAPGQLLLLDKGNTLMVYTLADGSLERIVIPDMTGRVVQTGLMDDGVLYLSVFREGIYVVDPYSGQIRYKRDAAHSGLTFDIVLSMVRLQDRILLGTDGGGLCVLDPADGSIRPLDEDSGLDGDALPTGSFSSLYAGPDGSIWAGSVRHGLFNLRRTFLRSVEAGRGVGGDVVIDLCALPDGRVWMATDGGGLDCYDPQTDHVTALAATAHEKVSSVCPFRGETLLISVYSKGLFVVDPRSGRKEPFLIQDRETDHLEFQSGYTPVVFRADDDDILVFSSTIYRYRLSDRSFARFGDGADLAGVRVFGRDGDGRLLAFSYQSLFRLDPADLTAEELFRVSDGRFINTAAWSDGRAWIGTDYGLKAVDLSTKETEPVETHLFSRVTQLKATTDTLLWIAADHALFRYAVKDGRLEILGESEGFSAQEILCAAPQGTTGYPVWLGGTNGLVEIADGRMPDVPGLRLPEFYEAFLDGRRISGVRGRLSLPRDYKSFDVTVNVRDLDPFSRKLFRFTLTGAGRDERVSFDDTYHIGLVPPGNYTLTSACMLRDGRWSDDATILSFRVRPPWYRSGWFYLVLLALLSAVAIFFIQYQAVRSREHYAQERIRFLTKISHEIRTPLTLIYAPLKRILEESAGSALEEPLSRVFRNVDRMKDITNLVLDREQSRLSTEAAQAIPQGFPAWLRALEDNDMGLPSAAPAAVEADPPDLSACTVLCVEDNAELRDLLKEELGRYCKTVRTASDGQEGLAAIRREEPDVVVSDVMMPVMDGFELCRQVKSDLSISHVHLVLLTARGDAASDLTGYKAGADSYLAKPFDTELLVQVIGNLLQAREKMKRRFLEPSAAGPSPEETTFTGADERFLRRFNELVDAHLGEAEFDVGAMASEMAMSRTSLYNKVKALTGLGVGQYVDSIKIRTACRLLETTDLGVAEIADRLGFGTPRYFSSHFKQVTGSTPLAWRREKAAHPREK